MSDSEFTSAGYSKAGRRFVLDTATGLFGFAAIVSLGAFGSAAASGLTLAASVGDGPGPGVALLGAVISILYALNMGFYRHLRTAYAPNPVRNQRSVGQDQA